MGFVYLEPSEVIKGKFNRIEFGSLHRLCDYLKIPRVTQRFQLLNFGYDYQIKGNSVIVEGVENWKKSILRDKYERIKRKKRQKQKRHN